MFFPESRVRVYLYGQPVDMRKSFNGLYAIARAAFTADPTSGDLYVFVNRLRNPWNHHRAMSRWAATTAATHVPGEEGMWLFVFVDMVVFALFFVACMYDHGHSVEPLVTSQAKLNQTIGVFNTFLMLPSSWVAAMAVQAAKRNVTRLVPWLLIGALVCSVGFVLVKFFECREKIQAGLTLTTNDFFIYYYMFTGIHLVHVLLGMAVLALLVRYTMSGPVDVSKISHLESGSPSGTWSTCCESCCSACCTW